MDKDHSQRTQERAYEIWEQEGRTGDPEDHWFRAEQEAKGSKSGDASQGKTAEDKIIDKLGDFA